MTMFITGGTSSIGRILVRELASQGVPMHVMVRKTSNRTMLEFPGVVSKGIHENHVLTFNSSAHLSMGM